MVTEKSYIIEMYVIHVFTKVQEVSRKIKRDQLQTLSNNRERPIGMISQIQSIEEGMRITFDIIEDTRDGDHKHELTDPHT